MLVLVVGSDLCLFQC